MKPVNKFWRDTMKWTGLSGLSSATIITIFQKRCATRIESDTKRLSMFTQDIQHLNHGMAVTKLNFMTGQQLQLAAPAKFTHCGSNSTVRMTNGQRNIYQMTKQLEPHVRSHRDNKLQLALSASPALFVSASTPATLFIGRVLPSTLDSKFLCM